MINLALSTKGSRQFSVSVWDRRKEILYGSVPACMSQQNNPPPECIFNGTDCHGNWNIHVGMSFNLQQKTYYRLQCHSFNNDFYPSVRKTVMGTRRAPIIWKYLNRQPRDMGEVVWKERGCNMCLELYLGSQSSHPALNQKRNIFNSRAVLWNAECLNAPYSFVMWVKEWRKENLNFQVRFFDYDKA